MSQIEEHTYDNKKKAIVTLFGKDESQSDFDDGDGYDYDFDEAMNEIDFSEIRGNDFKRSFANVKQKMNETKLSGVVVPDNRDVIVEGQGAYDDSEETLLSRDAKRMLSRKPTSLQKKAKTIVNTRRRGPITEDGETRIAGVVVGDDREVIIEGQGAESHIDIEKPPSLKSKKRPSRKKKEKPVNYIPVREQTIATLEGKEKQKIKQVIVPGHREVIVKGVSDFIISQENSEIKNIGYYKGKKLKELILTFNNNSENDFELAIFDPSAPLDYLYSTSLNLNNKIEVSGGAGTTYSDMLFNILANPTFIPNCQFIFSGPSVSLQRNQVLKSQLKSIDGYNYIDPLNLDLQIDTFQVAGDIVYFDISNKLHRPFIPDGMDVLNYTVLAGNTVTMCFYYQQVSLKKVFFPEARKKNPNQPQST